jgi:hypothetical protein
MTRRLTVRRGPDKLTELRMTTHNLHSLNIVNFIGLAVLKSTILDMPLQYSV